MIGMHPVSILIILSITINQDTLYAKLRITHSIVPANHLQSNWDDLYRAAPAGRGANITENRAAFIMRIV